MSLLPCLGLAVVMLAAPQPDEDEPPPPAIEKSFGEQLASQTAHFVRPLLPERYAHASDAQVCALGALGAGMGLGACALGFVLILAAYRVSVRLKGRHQNWREARRASQNEASSALGRAVSEAGPQPSLHESLLAVGLDGLSLEALDRAALKEQASSRKFAGWATALDAQGPEGAKWQTVLRKRCMHELVRKLVEDACRQDAQLGRRGLTAELIEGNGAWDIDLSFVRNDGLGATLDDNQRLVKRRIVTAARRAVAQLENPYAVVSSRDELAPPGASPSDLERTDGISTTSVLLYGSAALAHAGSVFTGRKPDPELEQALVRHQELIGAPADAAAVAVLLATCGQASALPGVGYLLAAVGGAALRPQAASLRLRQALPQWVGEPSLGPLLGQLGSSVARMLGQPAAASELGRATLELCHAPLLADSLAQARALENARARSSVQRPSDGSETLSDAVMEQHLAMLSRAIEGCQRAADRLLELLRALSMPEFAMALRSQALLGVTVAALDAQPLLDIVGEEAVAMRRQVRQILATRGVSWRP